jgi:hypothetical protein
MNLLAIFGLALASLFFLSCSQKFSGPTCSATIIIQGQPKTVNGLAGETVAIEGDNVEVTFNNDCSFTVRDPRVQGGAV